MGRRGPAKNKGRKAGRKKRRREVERKRGREQRRLAEDGQK